MMYAPHDSPGPMGCGGGDGTGGGGGVGGGGVGGGGGWMRMLKPKKDGP